MVLGRYRGGHRGGGGRCRDPAAGDSRDPLLPRRGRRGIPLPQRGVRRPSVLGRPGAHRRVPAPSATAAPPGHGRDVQGCATGPAQARDRAAHRGRDRPGRHPDRRARGAPAPPGPRRPAPPGALLRAADHRCQGGRGGRDAGVLRGHGGLPGPALGRRQAPAAAVGTAHPSLAGRRGQPGPRRQAAGRRGPPDRLGRRRAGARPAVAGPGAEGAPAVPRGGNRERQRGQPWPDLLPQAPGPAEHRPAGDPRGTGAELPHHRWNAALPAALRAEHPHDQRVDHGAAARHDGPHQPGLPARGAGHGQYHARATGA